MRASVRLCGQAVVPALHLYSRSFWHHEVYDFLVDMSQYTEDVQKAITKVKFFK